jgi:hypothetical protein
MNEQTRSEQSVSRYRNKPVEIEAVRFDGSPESGAVIVQWAQSHGAQEAEYHPFLADRFKGDPKVYVAHPDPYMRIKTLESVMTAGPGDWIIRGVKGEFSRCKPDIFAETYDSVDGTRS